MITGAYKAISAPALDIEAYTIPIKQELDSLTSNALLRIVSSPVDAKIIDSRPKTQTYLSTLETLTNRYKRTSKGLISNIEQIFPFTAPPWWTKKYIRRARCFVCVCVIFHNKLFHSSYITSRDHIRPIMASSLHIALIVQWLRQTADDESRVPRGDVVRNMISNHQIFILSEALSEIVASLVQPLVTEIDSYRDAHSTFLEPLPSSSVQQPFQHLRQSQMGRLSRGPVMAKYPICLPSRRRE